MRTKNALLNIIFNILLQVIVIVYGFLIPKIIIIGICFHLPHI